ncbi:MAG: serine/threonine protein kinase, partial [Lentisphaeria bacterium]|nr:serine/threonine protein kinase [Lentisphaeria bacterium]
MENNWNIEDNIKDGEVENFAGYRLLKQCGRGAFGEVFLAEDIMGNRVALKRFFGKRVDIKELNALKRYMRIAPHPSICRIYHCGIEAGTLYYVMELADNASESQDYSPDTLAARLSGHKRISFDEALKYCEEIASALEKIHGAGLTHRDIKPENIIFVNGCPKITDFGLLSDLALTQSIAGTLGFMPPELLEGKHVKGSSSDIYALGKLLYCSVTGMDAADYPSLPKGLPHETLRRLCLPIAKICAKDPNERCHDCSECIGLLKSMRAAPPGRLRSIWWQLRLNSGFRRSLAIVTTAVLILAAAVVYFGGNLYSQRRYEHRQAWQNAHGNLESLCNALKKMPLQISKEAYGDIIASNGAKNLTLGDLTDGNVRSRLVEFS